MGKAAQRNSSPQAPDCQQVKKQICSPSPFLPSIFPPGLCPGHRAAAGLGRGPTQPPVGGNSATCLTHRAEPRTEKGRRQTTRRGAGKQCREQSGAELPLSKGVRAREGWGATDGSCGAETSSIPLGLDQGIEWHPCQLPYLGFSGCSDPDPILQTAPEGRGLWKAVSGAQGASTPSPEVCAVKWGGAGDSGYMHPARKEAGPLGCPTDSPGIKIKGKRRLWRLSPIARLAAGAARLIQSGTLGLPRDLRC
ncbi:hypothetical protein H8959_000503 [Pygathrix nigripes]